MPDTKEYVKLWVSYDAYFEALGDAEVGRLARAMIQYKSTGTAPKFSGNERYIWPAIKRDIDEAKAAQQAHIEKQTENGSKGGRPRKPTGFSENPKNPPVFSETQKTHGLRTKDNGQRTMDKGQGTKDKDKELVADAAALVCADFLDRINPTASQSCLEELKAYADTMGEAVCKRAFDVALDSKKATWPYIRGILRRLQSEGVKCLADWEAKESTRTSGKTDLRDVQPSRERIKKNNDWLDKFLAEQEGKSG